ncbi:MAG: hypothetical protein ACRDI0_10025 [Actinomycetota bacterium]
MSEVAALRHETATAIQDLRSQADGPPSAEAQGAVLARIAARLERIEQGLERGERVLRDREGQAISSVLSILRRTADDVRSVRVEPKRPQVDSVVPGALDLLRADLARAVEEMRHQAGDIRQGVSRRQQDPEALRRLESVAAAIRQQVESALERISAAQRALEQRTGSLVHQLEQSLADIADRMAAVVRALEARISEEAAHRQAVRKEQAEHRKRLETAMVVLKDEVMLMATALRDEVAGPMAELAGDRETLRRGLDRVERLGDIVESLGRRRGFRELVKAERALQAEQAAFVERLNAAGEGLAVMAQGVERRLEAMVEAAVERIRPDPAHAEALAGAEASIDALRQDLPAAVGELVARVEESTRALQERFEALSGALEGRGEGESREDRQAAARAQRELRSATTSLRREVEGLSKRIEGWGKPRTAPRLAQEVRDLGRRFEALEQEVQSQVAAAVAKRVQASVDRRLRALLADLSEQIRRVAREASVEPAEAAASEASTETVRQPAPRFGPEPERRGRFRRPRR